MSDDFLKDIEEEANAPAPLPAIIDTLTDDEKRKVVEAWNNGATDLKDIIRFACGDKEDGRSRKGILVKKLLAENKMSAKSVGPHVKKQPLPELTDEQKEFIANNIASMKALEITRVLYNDLTLTPLGFHFRKVRDYILTLDPKVRTVKQEDALVKTYNPPKNEGHALARINKYAFNAIDPDKIMPRDKECMAKLIGYMQTYRFLYEINKLVSNSEREMFESCFVRWTYDKPDLTEEEIDLYINLCADIISQERMKDEEIALMEARDATMAEDQKIPMALVEALGKVRADMDKNKQRQKMTLNDLNGKRKDRLDKVSKSPETVLKLIEAFRDEKQRSVMVKFAKKRRDELQKTARELETMDDLRFQIWGASQEELI